MKPRLLLTAALLSLAAQAQAMTTLTFDGDVCASVPDGSGALVACGNFVPINQAYGDGDGVDVIYGYESGTTNSMQFWIDSYSTLERVAFGGVDPRVTLVGAVFLHGFDLGAYPNASRNSQVTVIDLADSSIVLSTGPITVLGSTPSSFSIERGSAAGFRIIFGPDGYNVGIDNISFTPGVVPEPGTFALWAAGLVAVAAVARRRHA